MNYRVMCRMLGSAGLAAFVYAGYLYVKRQGEEPLLLVEEPHQLLGNLVAGRDYEVAFRVHNRTRQTQRVVGAGTT